MKIKDSTYFLQKPEYQLTWKVLQPEKNNEEIWNLVFD